MLEGTTGVSACRTGGAEKVSAVAQRRTAPEPRRRDLLARLCVMSLTNPGHPPNGHPTAETEATAVARAWLDLVDDGRYAVVWTAAAPALRETIDEEEWDVALRSVRAPLGPCRSRKLRSRKTVETFPGVPPGPYAVIHFESGFAERAGVIETVTTSLGDDGRWRVAAYFVG